MKIAAHTAEEYLAKVDPTRQADLRALHQLITQEMPGHNPAVVAGMGSNMIGYGSLHYKYASGREGDWPVVTLAAQKHYISIYVCAVDKAAGLYVPEKYRDQLPKASIGRSCIRFKRLADIDTAVLRRIIDEAKRAEKAM